MDIFVHAPIESNVRSEAELISGELIIEGRLIDASNATLYGVIKNSIEDEFAVVYKPIAGERPLWDFPDGNLASREVAAFLVSKEGGFNCVPTTVLRDGPFGAGAVQEWIDIKEESDVIAIAQSSDGAIRNMALFDVVINNTDRKFGHILPVDEKIILGCDHGVAFHEEFKLRTVIWQFAGEKLHETERRQLENLNQWLNESGREILINFLTEIEITAMRERILRLLESGFPYPSQDWPAIPWPPV
jgi:uncharacterized repeat protein (TIGR03843 family)